MKSYSASYVLALLRARIASEGSQAKLAQKLGVSAAYLSDVMQLRRDPGPSILEPLGFVVRTVYVRAVRPEARLPETSPEVHDTLIDAERWRWFRDHSDHEERAAIVEYAEDRSDLLDHHIDKARCGL